MPKLSEKISRAGVQHGSGVYALGFVGDDRVYVGSSADLRARLGQHRWQFSTGAPVNGALRDALKEYGFAAARFKVLEYCPVEALEEREAFWAAQGPTFNKKAADRSGIERQRVSLSKVHAANRQALESDPLRPSVLAARKAAYLARAKVKNAKARAAKTDARLRKRLLKLQAQVAVVEKKIAANVKLLT